MTTSILNLAVILKVTKETEDRGVCSNSVTLSPEIIVTICSDTVSLAKHAITKKHFKSHLTVLYRIYSTIFITTPINGKAKKIELWIHKRFTCRNRISRENMFFLRMA